MRTHPFAYVAAAAVFTAGALFGGAALPRAQAQAAGERQPFQKLLLVPPDDKNYVVLKVPEGSRAVITDLTAYNATDGKGHKVAPGAEAYLWMGGFVDGKSVGIINRMRVLGNETEQWHLQTGMELAGAPELVISSDNTSPAPTPTLVYVNGYVTR